MWITKWVAMDEVFNYYPCLKIFSDYNSAKQYQAEIEEEMLNQENKMEELFDGKIVSEIYLEEMKIDVVEELNGKDILS